MKGRDWAVALLCHEAVSDVATSSASQPTTPRGKESRSSKGTKRGLPGSKDKEVGNETGLVEDVLMLHCIKRRAVSLVLQPHELRH